MRYGACRVAACPRVLRIVPHTVPTHGDLQHQMSNQRGGLFFFACSIACCICCIAPAAWPIMSPRLRT